MDLRELGTIEVKEPGLIKGFLMIGSIPLPYYF